MKPTHAYVTDYGTVRISEDEMRLLQIGEEAREWGLGLPLPLDRKIALLRGDIERVAKWKEGVRD